MANVTGWYAEVSAGITAPRMSATALLKPPSVDSVSPFIIAPSRMSATAVLKTPLLGFSTTLSAPRMGATATMAVPTIANFVNASITAPRMAATASLTAPAVGTSGTIAPPRMAATAAMAVPVVAVVNGSSVSDNFNRTNSSTLGASWNTDAAFGNSLTITSNAAVADSGGIGGNIYATPMPTGNNQITLVMKGTPSGGDVIFVFARTESATNTLASTKAVSLQITQGDHWVMTRYAADAGVATVGAESWADGDTIVFSCVGATLTVKRNGSTILTTGGATDLAAGYISLVVYSDGGAIGFDSFTAQDI